MNDLHTRVVVGTTLAVFGAEIFWHDEMQMPHSHDEITVEATEPVGAVVTASGAFEYAPLPSIERNQLHTVPFPARASPSCTLSSGVVSSGL